MVWYGRATCLQRWGENVVICCHEWVRKYKETRLLHFNIISAFCKYFAKKKYIQENQIRSQNGMLRDAEFIHCHIKSVSRLEVRTEFSRNFAADCILHIYADWMCEWIRLKYKTAKIIAEHIHWNFYKSTCQKKNWKEILWLQWDYKGDWNKYTCTYFRQYFFPWN